jgi:hypothetical protein
VFLLFFWMVAEVALVWEEARFVTHPIVIVESPHPEIQIAEFPEQPLDPYQHIRLIASRSHP